MRPSLRLQDLGSNNRAQVLELLRKESPLSRQEIAEKTGLSWGGMTKNVNALMEQGILEESISESSGPGRTPHKIALARNDHLLIGLDINLEGFSGIVANLNGAVLNSYFLPNTAKRADELLQQIVRVTDSILLDFRDKHFLALGVALQGAVDAEEGISVAFPSISDWHNVPLAAFLRDRTHLPVRVEHDPDCMLTAVHKGKEEQNALLFRIDRSIGMAVELNGTILRGPGILEIAHTLAVPDGLRCSCGQYGCLDPYIALCLENGEFHEDSARRMLPHLCRKICNCIRLFDPACVYLTGKLIHYESFLKPRLEKEMEKYPFAAGVPFHWIAEENHVVCGAAELAAEHFLRNYCSPGS